MALTKEDLRAIQELLEPINGRLRQLEQGQVAVNNLLGDIEERQKIHTHASMNLENKVMHELTLLNELLPDALAKREAFENMAADVDDHGHRIFALEQKVANS